MAKEEMPSNLKGYHLEKQGGMSLLKKLIIIAIIVLVVLYFFRRVWFDSIVDYVFNLF